MGINRKIMIVAGEASGDAHAAKLANALRKAEPATEFEFFGAAGPKMRVAGVEAVVSSDGLSIVGLAEIGRALPMFLRASRDLKKAAVDRKPDVVILVDFPDFNLKLAKYLKKQAFPIIYYISPQIWAWRKYRISAIKKCVDLLLTILPFEKDWYAKHGFTRVEYVGNPLANEVHSKRSKEEFCGDNAIDFNRPVISLLPGSRHKEIVRIAPVLFEAAIKLLDKVPDAQFIIPLASGRHRPEVELMIRAFVEDNRPTPALFCVVENETYDALNASDAAAVASGTATLETGLIGTPMAIVYKTSAVNFALLEPLISVEHYGLINLIAGKRVVKELIQAEFTAESLSSELLRLIQPDENAKMRRTLKEVAEKLGSGGASTRAAQAVLSLLKEKASG